MQADDRMGKTTESDAEIARLLQSDALDAQERGAMALHRRYSAPLMQYMERRCGLAEADAAEVLNQVLYRAIRRIHSLRETAKLSGWLYRLAHSAAMDWHRKDARRPPSISLDDPAAQQLASVPQAADDTRERADGGSGVDMIKQAMARLSERDQQVLTAVANDLTNPELALVLNVTPGHARVLRHRAVERLRQAAEQINVHGVGTSSRRR
ncbi:MAG TPA: sigma-70 family RNA polymerase sigma factor [Longimicrobium sp.]